MGRTAGSRFVVRKSQNSFGQKKALIAAATWSVRSVNDLGVGGGCWGEGESVQAAAVRIMRRAQWFFMSLPIARRWAVVGALLS